MSKILVFVCIAVCCSLFSVIFTGSLSISCDISADLSNGEAAKIITAHFKYPIVVTKQVAFRENSGEILEYLKKGDYIVSTAAQTCCGSFYATTEKGKPLFGEFVKQFENGDLYVDCGYARKAINSIRNISVDTKTNSAIVEYIESPEPNEPVYSAVFKKSRQGAEKIDFNETQIKRVKLKCFNKGWRVED